MGIGPLPGRPLPAYGVNQISGLTKLPRPFISLLRDNAQRVIFLFRSGVRLQANHLTSGAPTTSPEAQPLPAGWCPAAIDNADE